MKRNHMIPFRIFLESEVAGVVGRTFDLMRVAEEELSRAGDRPGWFAILVPPEGFTQLGDDVYRVHCRELIERLRRGQDCRPATDAELLAHVLRASLSCPLNQAGQAVAEHLFGELFPDHEVVKTRDRMPEVYRGQVEEDLEAYRRMLRVESRLMVATVAEI